MKYFLHDSSAFSDEKITLLYIRFGYEGVGLFFTILEKLAYQEKPINSEALKKQLSVGKRLEKCWNYLHEIELIYTKNGETFNEKLLNFSEKFKKNREKTREKVSQWRENQDDEKNVTSYKNVCNDANSKVRYSNVSNSNNLNDNLNLIPENSQNEFQAAPEPQLNLIESKPTKPKPTKEPKPKKEPKITEGTKEIVEQWYKQNNKTLYYTGKEAKAMVLICAKISNLINVNGKECNDTTIRDSLRLLLENVAKIDTWIYDNFNLSLFASKIETLADKMKNGQTAAPKFVSKEDERKAHNAELQRKILQKIATHIAENPNNPVH